MHAPLRIGAISAGVFGLLTVPSCAFVQPAPNADRKVQIAPTGRLRVGLVKIAFLAQQDPASGEWKGVAPDLGVEMARRLSVTYQTMPFDTPNAGIAALRSGAADITFLAPTPERSALIDFGPAFMQMEMTLIVRASSPIRSFTDADQAGRRIIAYERTAVEETLRRRTVNATLIKIPIFAHQQAFELIQSGQADAFADLRHALMSYQSDFPGYRILPGTYGTNALAIGYAKDRPAAAAFVRQFTAAMIASGFVKRSIAKAGLQGAAVPAE